MKALSKKIVLELINKNKQISFMESCTGGLLASEITNIEGSSKVLKVSLITYSNEFKSFFGINEKTIKEYSEYSKNTSEEMAKQIVRIAKSNYGVGITGKIGKNEKNKIVYCSIYDKDNDKIYNFEIIIKGFTRHMKKKFVAKKVFKKFLKII